MPAFPRPAELRQITPNNDYLNADQRDSFADNLPEPSPGTPGYVEQIDQAEGSNAYMLKAAAPQCVTHRKGWLKMRLGRVGCSDTRSSNPNWRWLCWYYAQYTNNCPGRYTKTIYFNCCDKTNGLFFAVNPTWYLTWNKGPNNSPSWYDCSCAYKVTIAPGQNRVLQYLSYGRRDVRESDDPSITPWDTFVTAVEFHPYGTRIQGA